MPNIGFDGWTPCLVDPGACNLPAILVGCYGRRFMSESGKIY